jgi:hypothetical protein
MAKSNLYTEQWFLERGYSPDGRGGFNPPPVKSEFVRSVKGELIIKEPIVKTPDFTAKPVTEWFIPYQIPSKKNSRQSFVSKNTGKMINIPSEAYKNYVTATKMYWEVFAKEFKRSVEILDLNYPLHIEFTFTRKTQQRFDYFGPGESAADLMVDFGFIPDDDTKHFKPFFADPLVDKNNPGVKIKLLTK